MKVLSVIGQKGGSGKTTVALAVATAAALDGQRAAVIDLDPQATAARWSDRRTHAADAPAVVSCQAARLDAVLATAKAQGVELAVIDTPGKATDVAIAAARAADFVLLPVQPQIFDLETLQAAADILAIAGKGKDRAAIVLQRTPTTGKRHIEAKAALESLGFAFAPILYQRAAHGDAAALGMTAQELDSSSKAAVEIIALYSYISSVL